MPAIRSVARNLARPVAALAVVLHLVPAGTAFAAWPGDPYNGNVPVSVVVGSQRYADIATDGAGGAVVVWRDSRDADADIYAQRISASGVPLWTANGVAVCSASGGQVDPRIAPDGLGGVVVTWSDSRSGPADNSNIYAQRVNASGEALWTANGVVVCNATGLQAAPAIVSDGAGGAIVAWGDPRGGAKFDIYAQRINSAGAPRWTANGVALCTAAGDHYFPQLVSDGAGGAIAVWEDSRNPSVDLYAQSVNGVGATQWTANGVGVCTVTGSQFAHAALSDGAGGVIVSWTDFRGADWDIQAQRVSAAGIALWGLGGSLVCDAPLDQVQSRLASDGAGGAIVTWEDARTGTWNIRAQRMSAGGGRLWTPNGVALTAHSGTAAQARPAPDGAGGAIVAWLDERAGVSPSVYAQRVSATGSPLWTADGVILSGAAGQKLFPVIVADDAGGAIVAWQDNRNGPSEDLYAQRVERHGQIGEPAPSIASVRDVPNDQGGSVKVSWSASPLDADPAYGIAEYRVYRSVPAVAALAALARGSVTANGDLAAEGGVFLATTSGANTLYWEFVGTQSAQAFAGYSLVAATTSDSVSGSNPFTAFLLEARGGTSLASPRWYSAPDSGYSKDNLAPVTPAPFTGTYSGGVARLAWHPNAEPDLAGYRLHRGTSASFVPDESNLVSAQPDTGYVDAGVAPQFYKLAAVDVHGNESTFAAWTPGGVLDAPATGVARLSFAPPAPNPATRAASLRFRLPRDAQVRLALHDAAGREVRVLASGPHAAGEHAATWDLRDAAGRAVGAGVYFARLETNGARQVRRIVVAR